MFPDILQAFHKLAKSRPKPRQTVHPFLDAIEIVRHGKYLHE